MVLVVCQVCDASAKGKLLSLFSALQYVLLVLLHKALYAIDLSDLILDRFIVLLNHAEKFFSELVLRAKVIFALNFYELLQFFRCPNLTVLNLV